MYSRHTRTPDTSSTAHRRGAEDAEEGAEEAFGGGALPIIGASHSAEYRDAGVQQQTKKDRATICPVVSSNSSPTSAPLRSFPGTAAPQRHRERLWGCTPDDPLVMLDTEPRSRGAKTKKHRQPNSPIVSSDSSASSAPLRLPDNRDDRIGTARFPPRSPRLRGDCPCRTPPEYQSIHAGTRARD
jgi:hypothetical protein